MRDTGIEFGPRLAAIRRQRRITPAQLGAAIGKSPTTICEWERGDRVDVRPGDVLACARALHCRLADLLAPLD